MEGQTVNELRTSVFIGDADIPVIVGYAWSEAEPENEITAGPWIQYVKLESGAILKRSILTDLQEEQIFEECLNRGNENRPDERDL